MVDNISDDQRPFDDDDYYDGPDDTGDYLCLEEGGSGPCRLFDCPKWGGDGLCLLHLHNSLNLY